MEPKSKPNTAPGFLFGCLVWIGIFGTLLTCLVPTAIFSGLLTGFFAADPVAKVVGPMLCPKDTTPYIHTFPTTTLDDNGFEVPATGGEMQCLGAEGQVVAEPKFDYQNAWIGILVVISIILSGLIAFLVAGPVGILVNKLLDRMKVKKNIGGEMPPKLDLSVIKFMKLFVVLFFLAGCGSNQLESTVKATSTREISSTNTPTIVSVTPTLAKSDIPKNSLQEIHMMDETSGWAWSVDDAQNSRLLHSSDGGVTWIDVTPGEYTGITFFLNSQMAWAPLIDLSTGRAAQLMFTADGGSTWVPINQNMQTVDAFPYFSIFGFEDEKNGWWRTGTVGAGTAHLYFYRTRDGGKTWEPVFITVPKEMSDNYYIDSSATEGSFEEISVCNICGTLFYFDLSRVIFSPGQWSPGTFFVTTNLGAAWHKIELTDLPADIDPESSPIQYPTFFNDKEGILPVIVNDPKMDDVQIFIYGTQDSGLTWKLENEPTGLNKKENGGADVQFVSLLDGFLYSDNNLWITHDGGQSWTITPWPMGFANSETTRIEPKLNFVTPKTGWVILEKHEKDTGNVLASILLKTADGGLTWIEIVPSIELK